MIKLKKIVLGVIVLLMTALLVTAAALSLNALSPEKAFAVNYRVSGRSTEKSYVSGENDVVFNVFVNKTLYEETAFLEISYQRVKLNSVADRGNVTTSNGKAVSSEYEVLEEDVIVHKSDLIRNENVYNEAEYYYFEVKTKVNCAWIFTIRYKSYEEDDLQVEYGSDVLYCVQVDNKAPTLTVSSKALVSNEYHYYLYVTDSDNRSAVSGIKRVAVYKQGINDEEPVLFLERDGKKQTRWSEEVFLKLGKVTYTYEISDVVGNLTKGTLAVFTDESYDKDTEMLASEALEYMKTHSFDATIKGELEDANAKYMLVTRDDKETEENKQKALSALRNALTKYNVARNKYESGNADISVEIIDVDNVGVTVSGEQQAFAFLPIGDESTISVTASKSKYASALKLENELEQAGLKEASEVYSFVVKTTSKNEYTVRQELPKPLKLRLTVGEYEKVGAVMKTYNVDGQAEYYPCLAVAYADGTIGVEATYSAGTIYLFTETKENKPYWLFSLAAVPLVVGGVMFLWANKKMKKVKEEALKKREEEKKNNQPPKEEK